MIDANLGCVRFKKSIITTLYIEAGTGTGIEAGCPEKVCDKCGKPYEQELGAKSNSENLVPKDWGVDKSGNYNGKAQKDYENASHKITEEFKQALFKHYGVENNPKREKAYELAWEEGHSNGYSEVEIYFSDFVHLIK